MKKNLLALFAVGTAIAFSAFTTPKFADFFLVYKGTSFPNQTIASSYNTPVSEQPGSVSGTGLLNWIRVADNNGTAGIQDSEVAAAVASYDNDGDNTLNDLTADISGNVDVKAD